MGFVSLLKEGDWNFCLRKVDCRSVFYMAKIYNGVELSIKWSIVSTAPSYKCGGSRCNLCLAEKLAILSGNRKIMLNKRSEIVNTCCHRKKFKLKSIRFDGLL